MKKVGVCGHFGIGLNLLNGQTIKTKCVTDELINQLGKENVEIVDSHGGAKAFPRMMVQLFGLFKRCQSIIMMPAHKGVRVFTVLFSFYNIFFHRKIEYVVIGGWLDSFVDQHKWLKKSLMKFDGIFVETTTMKRALESKGFKNIIVMPNFKKLNILNSDELNYQQCEPYKVCTFSRVMKEKGIEDAANVIKSINEEMGRTVYELDIYGQVFQWEDFEQFCEELPLYVQYKGSVPFDKSVEVLKNYYLLLFPTKFYTEGIPGTIIDAYAAGVPVIASKWESFSDVIDDGVTGIGYEFNNLEELRKLLVNCAKENLLIKNMKSKCLKKAEEFMPASGVSPLVKQVDRG